LPRTENAASSAPGTPIHFVRHAILRPEDAAEDRLRKRPTVRHELLPKDRERLRQSISRCSAQRLREPIAADILHPEFPARDVGLDFLRPSQVANIGQGLNTRAREQAA